MVREEQGSSVPHALGDNVVREADTVSLLNNGDRKSFLNSGTIVSTAARKKRARTMRADPSVERESRVSVV